MTIFLCIMVALVASGDWELKNCSNWVIPVVLFLRVVLVLGLAVLAVYAWRVS